MINPSDIDGIIGSDTVGPDGGSIGSVKQVYVADDTNAPVWVTVKTGLFGTSESFVPLDGATFDGSVLSVDFEKSFVKDAPRIDADRSLDAEQEAELYSYYGLDRPGPATGEHSGEPDAGRHSCHDDEDTLGDATAGAAGSDAAGSDAAAGTAGFAGTAAAGQFGETASAGETVAPDETAAPGLAGEPATTDESNPLGAAGTAGSVPGRPDDAYLVQNDAVDAGANDGLASTGHDGLGDDAASHANEQSVTRSEEQLRVGTERVEAGRARLRKHIVTEQQTVNVPVSHDELRITREPITDGQPGATELSEDEVEIVLNKDQIVTDKTTVPVERISLGTESVTEDQKVTEDVRHEEIEIDDDLLSSENGRA